MKKLSTLLGLGLVLSASGVRAGEMPVMPSQAEPGMEAPFYGDDHSACCGDRCRGGCLHRFCEWLTYRPLTRPCLCDCCHHCTGCCYPPLYTFFLCQGCNGYPPAMAHGGPACTCGAGSECAGCRPRSECSRCPGKSGSATDERDRIMEQPRSHPHVPSNPVS